MTALPYSFSQVRQYRELVELVHNIAQLRAQISQLEADLAASPGAAGNLSVAIGHKQLTAKRTEREAHIREAEELANAIVEKISEELESEEAPARPYAASSRPRPRDGKLHLPGMVGGGVMLAEVACLAIGVAIMLRPVDRGVLSLAATGPTTSVMQRVVRTETRSEALVGQASAMSAEATVDVTETATSQMQFDLAADVEDDAAVEWDWYLGADLGEADAGS